MVFCSYSFRAISEPRGRTTVYDKANPLVSGEEYNGKITKTEQGAAGSLVKEGKRSYSHSRLDKVSRVKMNGMEVVSFTCLTDGQIATAKANGRQEHFFWDNLAMISRNETEYGNEPDVTGGSPILADGDVLFNDLLGTTIGIRSGKEYRETGMTAFGETDEKSAMFTGKPYIGDLGYAFLFRNYRPGLGKWQTSDPLGYPDGWNNFAYVNNGVTMNIDWLGGCTLFSTCPERTDADYRTETVTQIINNDILCVVTVGCSAGSNKCEPQGSLDFSFDITGNYWGINFNVKGSYSIKHVQHEVAAYVCSSEMHDGSGQKSVKYEVNTWVVLTKHERTCGEKYITQQEYYEWKNSAKMTKCE